MKTKTDFLKDLPYKFGVSSEYKNARFMPVVDTDVAGNVLDTKRAVSILTANDAAIGNGTVGVPVLFTTFLNPNVVNTLYAAMKAQNFFGAPVRHGDWTTQTQTFALTDVAGTVSPYNDDDEGASTTTTLDFTNRDAYLFSTMIKYGQLEAATTAEAGIDLVAKKQQGAAEVLGRYQNKFYFYGVAGKRIYGLLNDPNLPAAITPNSIGGKVKWADKKTVDHGANSSYTNAIYEDVLKLFSTLLENVGSNIDENDVMVLGVPSGCFAELASTNVFGKSAQELLKEHFPNLKIEKVPELKTKEGNMLYLCLPNLLGSKTAELAFNENYRMMNVVPLTSSYKQKVVAGTFGAIIYRPQAIATMVGI
ncbi:MAG: DUF2184 domain-containing protein [Sutterella wadsworthensis]|nr:DUF2184 domain-containing protein [Sutterella wadsworthensis]